ncbi:MAG: universal stress protein [Myxococcota bacterium]
MFKRILFATDFSNEAAVAREEAVRLALRWEAALGLVHVQRSLKSTWYSFERFYDQINEQLREGAKTQLKREVNAIKALGLELESSVVLEGEEPTHEQISSFGKAWGADLLVIGTHGQDQAEVFAWGTTASNLVRVAHMPVLSVRTDQEPGFQNILVPVSFTPACAQALDMGIALARQSDRCVLHIVHAVEPIGLSSMRVVSEASRDEYILQIETAANEEIQKFVASVDFGDLDEVKTAIVRDQPHGGMLDYASKNNVDLICMSTLGRQGFTGMLLGNTAERILRGSRCSMLTLRIAETPS